MYFFSECPIESGYVWVDLQIHPLAKKSSWRAVVGMRWPEVIYQEVNKSRLADHFNKIHRGREEKRPSTIDIKAFVFFFVYVYTFFLTVFFINKGELMEWESSLFAD